MICRLGCLVSVACLWAPAHAASAQPTTFAGCGIELEAPPDWVVLADDGVEPPRCGLMLRPVAWDSLLIASDSIDGFTTLIRVSEESFSASVAGSPFWYADGAWWVGGRAGLRDVASAVGRGEWRGVVGYGQFGCYRVGGGYAGACEFLVAVVGTDRRSALIQGGPDDVVRTVLVTLRFVP